MRWFSRGCKKCRHLFAMHALLALQYKELANFTHLRAVWPRVVVFC